MKLILTLLLTSTFAQAAFSPLPTATQTFGGLPTMPKGAIVASNGGNNGQFALCADDEILVWDSSATAGIKCAANVHTPAYTPLVLLAGEFVSNNGSVDVVVPACADGEILEYDSVEPDGTKCVVKPPTYTPPTKMCSFLVGSSNAATSNIVGSCNPSGSAPNSDSVISFSGFSKVNCTCSSYTLNTPTVNCIIESVSATTLVIGSTNAVSVLCIGQ